MCSTVKPRMPQEVNIYPFKVNNIYCQLNMLKEIIVWNFIEQPYDVWKMRNVLWSTYFLQSTPCTSIEVNPQWIRYKLIIFQTWKTVLMKYILDNEMSSFNWTISISWQMLNSSRKKGPKEKNPTCRPICIPPVWNNVKSTLIQCTCIVFVRKRNYHCRCWPCTFDLRRRHTTGELAFVV